ncbi:MAG: hypothetical protein N2556_05950 [Anaerolineae bacterium]|nr:hypothetical protein [Anaerolineae bacterium]
MIRKLYFWLIVLAVITVGVLAACGGRTETPTPPATVPTPELTLSPASDGATLLRERCTACHTLDRVESARKALEEWEQTVDRMVRRGAQLTEAERAVLVKYLAERYR